MTGALVDAKDALLGAYRSDELYPRLPMREWRARLLTQRLAEEVRLPRLTLEQTATVASAVLGQAAPARIVAAIHDRSDGIPLHVEEFLAAVADPGAGISDLPVPDTADPAAEPDSGGIGSIPVPDTLADAVLARARVLDAASREVAHAAAVIGRSFEFDLLAAVSQHAPATVDHGLRRVAATAPPARARR